MVKELVCTMEHQREMSLPITHFKLIRPGED